MRSINLKHANLDKRTLFVVHTQVSSVLAHTAVPVFHSTVCATPNVLATNTALIFSKDALVKTNA